jgi:FkbM family methyltransferase
MTIRRQLKRFVEKSTNTHIYQVLPRGVDLLHDVTKDLPTFQAEVVLDVGANVGQSASTFAHWFPKAQIYCFEPASHTFERLRENLKSNERVQCFQLALGASRGKRRLLLRGPSTTFRLSDPSKDKSEKDDLDTEEVYLETIDEFCRDNKINQISYLKIDTEEGDLAVLKGAENLLSDHRIDLVECEAGMNSGNKWHVPFEILKASLGLKRYFLFGIYEQKKEWPTKEPQLRRANLVFISERMISANGG